MEDLQEGHSVIVSSGLCAVLPNAGQCSAISFVKYYLWASSDSGIVSVVIVIISCFVVMQTFIATGTNLNLQFCRNALQDEKPPNCRPTRESVDFDREPGKVRGDIAGLVLGAMRECCLQAHLCSPMIFNGVCVNWVGCMDLETLTGKARLAFNEEMAKVLLYGYTVLCGVMVSCRAVRCWCICPGGG